jgi:hypothetical protein
VGGSRNIGGAGEQSVAPSPRRTIPAGPARASVTDGTLLRSGPPHPRTMRQGGRFPIAAREWEGGREGGREREGGMGRDM